MPGKASNLITSVFFSSTSSGQQWRPNEIILTLIRLFSFCSLDSTNFRPNMILPIDQRRGSAAAPAPAATWLSSSWIPRPSSATAKAPGAKWNYHRHQCYYSVCPLKTFYRKEIIKIRFRSGSSTFGTDQV